MGEVIIDIKIVQDVVLLSVLYGSLNQITWIVPGIIFDYYKNSRIQNFHKKVPQYVWIKTYDTLKERLEIYLKENIKLVNHFLWNNIKL